MDTESIELINYLQANERYELCSIYDKNKNRCKELSLNYNIEGYDDFRQLISSEKLEIIILNLPNYQSDECIISAVGFGCNIFKLQPVARDFSEAQSWANLTEKNQCAFAISCPTRNNPLYDKISDMICIEKSIGTLYYSNINNFCQFEGVLDWRGEPNISGGGVLLEGNFQFMDFLIRVCGLPQRVFSVHTDLCKKISVPPYLTEDTAQITMEYNDRSIATLSCGWMAGMKSFSMTFYGTEGSIVTDGMKIARYNRQNEIVEEQTFSDTEIKPVFSQLELFADHLDNRSFTLGGSAKSYNNTIATINAAYLSATTRTPEEPARLMEHL